MNFSWLHSFSRSFTRIAATNILQQVENQYQDEHYWPETLIQINPNYKRQLNQLQTIAKAQSGKSFVVTIGTGSGRSLSFFIPVIDKILKKKRLIPLLKLELS